ncbi:MAG: sugar transferase [Thiohalospira sp.]
MYKKFLKRLIDLIISLLLLILFSPIISIFIVLLSYTNKWNPFFLHPRPGKNEKIFKVIKFKTMNDHKDENGDLLPDKYRLTRIGKIIRRMSLDELPQLLNVLKGDMSLVGPRPLLVEYLPYYTDFERCRHKVKPGITGLSQISGRNKILWTKRMELDVYYAENFSFIMDLKIIIKTIIKVLICQGISVDVGDLGRAPLHVRRDPKNKGLYDENGFPLNKDNKITD